MLPSSFPMGCAPPSTSIILSRRWPSAAIPLQKYPQPSGPRCTTASHMRAISDWPKTGSPSDRYPAIPHISLNVSLSQFVVLLFLVIGVEGRVDRFKQPVGVALQEDGDALPQLRRWFAKSVHDLTEQGIIYTEHLSQAILANASLPQL